MELVSHHAGLVQLHACSFSFVKKISKKNTKLLSEKQAEENRWIPEKEKAKHVLNI